jgi:hypothetical protein
MEIITNCDIPSEIPNAIDVMKNIAHIKIFKVNTKPFEIFASPLKNRTVRIIVMGTKADPKNETMPS